MQTLLFKTAVFTRGGVVGWVEQVSDDESRALVLLATHKKEWLCAAELFSVEQECLRRRIEVFAAVQIAEDAMHIKDFPDMSKLNLPNGPRESRLPKSIRDVQLHGVYRPDEISAAFRAHAVAVAPQTRICVQWSVYVHTRIIPIMRAVGVDVPRTVRCMKTGIHVPDAKPAGGVQGYVFMPAPIDLSIMNKELQAAVRSNGTMRIGNFRFALGLHLMNKERWPINWLTEDAPEEDLQPSLLTV